MKKIQYRGRFAPSPSGPLHLGSLYTAVASYLDAKSKQGIWLVRIDDLDPLRCKDEHATHILNTLEKFNLIWDETVLYQSSRLSAYQSALQQLQDSHAVYPCSCSRKQIKLRTGAADHYDQHCLAQKTVEEPVAQRFIVQSKQLSFYDQVQGQHLQTLNDFIVLRKDDVFAYHLAAVIDDHYQSINYILRGHDLLSSTPNQIALQQSLNIKAPEYAHIPVITDQHQHKLSKQTFAGDVAKLAIEQTLIQILQLLNLNPPSQLSYASPQEILQWAVQNWQLANIKKQTSITAK